MQHLAPGAVVLRGFALPWVDDILPVIEELDAADSFRNMVTRGGYTISVALTNLGELGWTSDRRGYRYSPLDPETGRPWHDLPGAFRSLAVAAAEAAGYPGFDPDACLVNRYLPGNRLTLHQDKNERDFTAPIVSVSLGLPATFLFGGDERSDKTQKVKLVHGDVAVWGSVSRMRYHGVSPLKDGKHPLLGSRRINLTFRKAG